MYVCMYVYMHVFMCLYLSADIKFKVHRFKVPLYHWDSHCYKPLPISAHWCWLAGAIQAFTLPPFCCLWAWYCVFHKL